MKIFNDKKLNDEFEEFGYVKISFFNKKECKAIKKFAKKMIAEAKIKDPILNGVPNKHSEDKIAIAVKVFFEKLLQKKTETIFTNDYSFIGGVFFIKTKRSKKLSWHNDISIYDQKKYERPFAIWSGIEKTTKYNGCLRIVPKSHKLAFNFEPHPKSNMHKNKVVKSLYDDLIDKYAVDVPLNYGEVIIHDQSIIHASHPNNSYLKKRIAFKLTYLPKIIDEFKFCIQNQSKNQYELYSIDKNYIKKHLIKCIHTYKKENLLKIIKYNKHDYSFNSLAEMEQIMNTPITSLKSKFEIF